MAVTEKGFARLIDIIMDVADTVCEGRLVVTLEGGYHLEGQARSVVEVVKRMAGDGMPDRGRWEGQETKEYPHIRGIVAELKENLNDFWQLDG
jgi:acetoin utilization deacetylase AcuC-like enzyme